MAMRLSCVLLVASVALFATGNALPASTNSDQTAVAKAGVAKDNRFLRSADTVPDDNDNSEEQDDAGEDEDQDDADEDDSSEDEDEERMLNLSVLLGLKTADEAAAQAKAAAIKADNIAFQEKLVKSLSFRKSTFTRWRTSDNRFPDEIARYMERYKNDPRFKKIAEEYDDFFKNFKAT
ncbi:hypothetical protein PHYBOEH_003398 [Phytophthora boehmeriae]|uniref:RxLR effector protein n=1 Tax=Phytophthora boehmeriae TaxID=109152 RepID=A0A8T1WQZ1_9STRA|nr:hypothetical protein PHYBOEH_003398 [Phytophthora boehmeriae]